MIPEKMQIKNGAYVVTHSSGVTSTLTRETLEKLRASFKRGSQCMYADMRHIESMIMALPDPLPILDPNAVTKHPL